LARIYRLGKRAEAVAQSRQRIIAAARSLLSAPDHPGLSLESVAEAAGVSRPTVYNQFESKRGIIAALFEDIGKRIQFERVHDALADPDPRRALERSVTEHCRAWQRDARVIRRVLALATVDSDLEALVERFESMRRNSYGPLVTRLQQTRALRSGLAPDEAIAALGVLTSFTTFDQLRSAGVSSRSIARVLCQLSSSVLRTS
jgi:AcrR family transcriptional regulator